SMVALFTVPFIYKDIGGEIGQVSGVLMSYWLYIHVTMVTASYALIGMAFLLSIWWLIKYYANREAVEQVSPHQISGEARLTDPWNPDGAPTLTRASSMNEMEMVLRPPRLHWT